MVRACSTHGTDEKCIQHLVENLKGWNHLEDPGVDGKVILWGGMHVANDWEEWWVFVNTVMNLRIP
jgi:hypothetical protein